MENLSLERLTAEGESLKGEKGNPAEEGGKVEEEETSDLPNRAQDWGGARESGKRERAIRWRSSLRESGGEGWSLSATTS